MCVTGIDHDESFIIYARDAAARESLPLNFVVRDALALPFENASFDLVTSHALFNCVPDPEKAMNELKRVVRPGGRTSSLRCHLAAYGRPALKEKYRKTSTKEVIRVVKLFQA